MYVCIHICIYTYISASGGEEEEVVQAVSSVWPIRHGAAAAAPSGRIFQKSAQKILCTENSVQS